MYSPYLQAGEDLSCHRPIERVELLGPVELNAPEAVDGAEQDVVGLIAGELFGNIGSRRHLYQISIALKLCTSVAKRLHTVAALKAGLVTLARRGIAGEENREIQLCGEGSRETECRSSMKTGDGERMEKEWRKVRIKLDNNQMFSSPLYRRPREF